MNRIKELRALNKISQKELSKIIGVAQNTFSQYETGKREPDNNTLIRLADYFGVSIDFLLGQTDIKKEPSNQKIGQLINIKIIASVKAGYDGTAVEDYTEENEAIPEHLLRGYPPEECRIFIASGNSMYPKILEGDRLIVHVQSAVDNGDIAIVIYNGDEGTVKKIDSGKGYIDLIPINPEYQTKHITGEDLDICRIWGKVIGLWRTM